MTDAEIKALKIGDRVKLYWHVDYRGQKLGGTHILTINRIVTRTVSTADKARGHMWLTATANETGDKQWVIESDEYLSAFGYATHEASYGGFGGNVIGTSRKLGAEKL